MEQNVVPVYTPSQIYPMGCVVRKGYKLYVAKRDISLAPQDFNEEDWQELNQAE